MFVRDSKTFAAISSTSNPVGGATEASNWVLVHAKLKKMFKSISQYYESRFRQSIDLLEPNLSAIARDGNIEALVTFVNLVLVLAVQSERRQFYIEMIQKMDQENQVAVMVIIESTLKIIQNEQAAEPGSQKSSPSRRPPTSPVRESSGKSSSEVDKLQRERNEFELSLKMANKNMDALRSQNDALSLDLNSLQAQLHETESKLRSLEKSGSSETVLKSEINILKSQVEKFEVYKHELEHTIASQNEVIIDLNKKLEESSFKLAESSNVKDKLDELLHLNEKLMKADQTIERLKKRVEEGGDSRKQLKDLEIEYDALLKKHSQLDEEYQKVSTFKPLMETYKSKAVEVEHNNSKLISEKMKLEYDMEKMTAKVSELEEQVVMEQKAAEILREQIEFHDSRGLNGDQNNLGADFAYEGESKRITSLELQIVSLQKENLLLRNQSADHESNQKILVLENLLQDSNSLKSKYENDYLDAHKKLMFLESEVNALRDGQSVAEAEIVLRLRKDINEYESDVTRLKKTIVELNVNLEKAHNDLTVVRSELSLVGKDQRRQVSKDMALLDSEVEGLQLDNKKINEQRRQIETEKQRYMDQLHDALVEKDALQQDKINLKDEALKAERIVNQLKEDIVNLEKGRTGSENIKIDLQQRDEQIMQLQKALKKAKDYILQQEKVIKERRTDNQDQPNHFNEAVISLQSSVKEKEAELERVKRDYEAQILTHRQEQKLMGSAWYELGMQLQKKHMLPNQITDSPSWLRRQRKSILESPIRRR